MSDTKPDVERARELAKEMHNALKYYGANKETKELPLLLGAARFREVAGQLEALADENAKLRELTNRIEFTATGQAEF